MIFFFNIIWMLKQFHTALVANANRKPFQINCMRLLGVFLRKWLEYNLTRPIEPTKNVVYPRQKYPQDITRVRFSSLEAETEASLARRRGRRRESSKGRKGFPQPSNPTNSAELSTRTVFLFTACRKAAVCISTEQTSYLNSNRVWFVFAEHLDKKNQNGHQTTKYYYKTHNKMLPKQMVNKTVCSWSEPSWINSCSYWSWWEML